MSYALFLGMIRRLDYTKKNNTDIVCKTMSIVYHQVPFLCTWYLVPFRGSYLPISRNKITIRMIVHLVPFYVLLPIRILFLVPIGSIGTLYVALLVAWRNLVSETSIPNPPF